MARIVDLQGGQLLRVSAASGARVQVMFGAIWLTEPGRPEDVFAADGEEVILDHGDGVLIEAQGFARLIVPSFRPRPLLADALHRLRAAARRLLPLAAFATR